MATARSKVAASELDPVTLSTSVKLLRLVTLFGRAINPFWVELNEFHLAPLVN